MNKILQGVTAVILAAAMIAAPVADAQTRGRSGYAERSGASASSKSSTPRKGAVSGTERRQGGSPANVSRNNHGGQSSRPGNTSGGNKGTYRSGNGTPSVNKGSHRPGNQPGLTYRQQPGNNRPGHHGAGGHYAPGHNRPAPPPPPPAPPRRLEYGYCHHVPFFGVFSRPVPPPRWHYVGGGPVFGTILGVALGTAIGVSLGSLVNSGYTVSGYGDNVVYLQNVPQMNYVWPDAALYYNNGMLYGSQFTYPSPYYDLSRYSNLYNAFTMQYGMPVQTSSVGGVMSASWFGAGNRYVTLSYGLQGGSYYTTLSFGN